MDVLLLLTLAAATIAILAITLRHVHGFFGRLMVSGFLGGLFVYSGVGGAYPQVRSTYVVLYVLFAIAFSISYVLAYRLLWRLGRYSSNVLPKALASVDEGGIWGMVIPLYLLLALIPFLYPAIRLSDLFSPSSPDLATLFALRFDGSGVPLIDFVGDAQLLLSPFFYIALYRYRRHFVVIAGSISAVLYFEYVENTYLGRGTVMLAAALLFLGAWRLYPWRRRLLTLVALIAIPLGVVAIYAYGEVRLGRSVGNVDVMDAGAAIINAETSFPRDVGAPLIAGGARVDLTEYATWIVTLPVPRFIAAQTNVALINYEISEAVLGRARGSPGWYVALSGLVAEAVYVYSVPFSWFHAVVIGFAAAFFVRLLENSSESTFLAVFIALVFAYVLNRAGIAATLPRLLNPFLGFFVFVYVLGRRPGVGLKEGALPDDAALVSAGTASSDRRGRPG